ncbi:hypothetical protein CHS0354_016945 [Potamilus streckersoni]|uniref:Uncharacterized protein n=1 Tax=Potamilus streckersoni TaxID=2493646 RepID=A0AAE0VRW2_9BIVA|nr:hypothetical protein CHS0354_016945 [Potamilus streckersoni]
MYPGKLILFAGLMTYVNSVRIGMETVWLKDVTTTIQTDKRTIGDHGLPAQLTFHLMRGSGDLTLTLKRNYDIDPNADIYVVQRTKDGRSILSKTRNLEREDVAYYQDIEHGAYMTVRCVRRLSHQCDRVIKGNIQIGDRSFELRPAEASDISEHSLELPHVNGKRYLLLDPKSIGQKNLAANEDTLRETIVQRELQSIIRPINGQKKQNDFLFTSDSNGSLPPRNIENLHNRRTNGENKYGEKNMRELYCVTH